MFIDNTIQCTMATEDIPLVVKGTHPPLYTALKRLTAHVTCFIEEVHYSCNDQTKLKS